MENPHYQTVIWGFYPLWLLAGAIDYGCHRRTRLECTSGITESSLHVLQFLCIAVLALLLTQFVTRGAALTGAALIVLMHTVLSYVDVRYTQPRREISSLEQHAHAFLIVLPAMAVMTLAVTDLELGLPSGPRRAVSAWQSALLFLSLLVIAGLPTLEELLRTLRQGARLKRVWRPLDRTRSRAP